MKKKWLIAVGLLMVSMVVGAAPKIIFDTDFGSDADDLGALAMLHRFIDTEECELLGIAFTKSETYGVSAIDAVNRFYDHPDIPVGARPGGKYYVDWFHSKAIADRFPHQLSKEDVPPAAALYRKILSTSEDHSITIVTVGPLFNISDLLKSEADEFSPFSGKELVDRKVKEFVIMGGRFPEGKPECNFSADRTAGLTTFVLENINRPITFSGAEVGQPIKTGQVFNDPDTPLYVGYNYFFQHAPWVKQEYKGVMRDNASFDQTAVLYAVRGGIGTWWDRSPNGTCVVDEQGSTHWIDDMDGSHTYLKLTVDPEEIAQLIESVMLHR